VLDTRNERRGRADRDIRPGGCGGVSGRDEDSGKPEAAQDEADEPAEEAGDERAARR
jgi:hypothetical protein